MLVGENIRHTAYLSKGRAYVDSKARCLAGRSAGYARFCIFLGLGFILQELKARQRQTGNANELYEKERVCLLLLVSRLHRCFL